MIGQFKNQEIIKRWRLNRAVPRFIIIEGDEGSGRLTLAKKIIKMVNATGVIPSNSIDSVREVINNSYTVTSPTAYIFRDADDMSIPAKNALLKIIEEPPNKAYFIMTVKSIDGTLSTIKSRGTALKMAPYTDDELKKFASNELILKYIRTPGQCLNTDVNELKQAIDVSREIINALCDKSGVKMLKATTKLANKVGDANKIDCTVFFNVFAKEFLENLDSHIFSNCVVLLGKCEQELSRKSVNKKSAIEAMLMNILEVYRNAV